MTVRTINDPYALNDDMRAELEALGLEGHFRDLIDDGFTVLEDPQANRIVDGVREAVLRHVPMAESQRAGAQFTLLDKDPIFGEAVALPRLVALIESILGRGAVFSQLSGSRRRKGPTSLGLHADNSWFPAPFPRWEIMCTACFVTDSFTLEEGATMVIPGSHHLRTYPPKPERRAPQGAIPVVAPKGSIAIWVGSLWHGNYPRQEDGQRVVLHMTYTRMGFQPIENYDHLPESWFEGKPDSLRRLLGREHFLGRRDGWKEDMPTLLKQTYDFAHGPDFRDSPSNTGYRPNTNGGVSNT